MRELIRRVLHTLRRDRFEDDLAEELEYHRAMKQRDFEQAGLDAREAGYAARRALGNMELAQERARDVWIAPWFRDAWQDVRFAVRSLNKDRAFTTASILTLALGIGATTAIFSTVYAVLLQPLPYRDPQQLVAVLKKNPPRGWRNNPISAVEVIAWRQAKVLDGLAAFTGASCVLTGGAGAEEDPCEVAESRLFPLLGVSPFIGRTFTAEEDQANGARAAILSYGLWQRRFGADAAAIGRAIEINGTVHTIVGVMPPGFSHLYASPYAPIPQLWVSGIGLQPTNAGNLYLAVGRLRPDLAPELAQAALDAVSEQVERAHPDLKGWRAEFTALRDVQRGRYGTGAPRPGGGRRLRAVDRVRQRREPAAGPRHRTRKRDGGAQGTRRRPLARHPPAADGKRRARARGRRAGRRRRLVGHQRADHAGAVVPAEFGARVFPVSWTSGSSSSRSGSRLRRRCSSVWRLRGSTRGPTSPTR